MGLKVRHNGIISDLAGEEYEPGSLGTKRLKIRTGAGVKEYGLTTDPNATLYCGLNFKIDGQKYFIGRKQSETVATTTTSQGNSTRQGDASVPASSTSYAWATRSSQYNTYSYAYTYTYVTNSTTNRTYPRYVYSNVTSVGKVSCSRYITRISSTNGGSRTCSIFYDTYSWMNANSYGASFTSYTNNVQVNNKVPYEQSEWIQDSGVWAKTDQYGTSSICNAAMRNRWYTSWVSYVRSEQMNEAGVFQTTLTSNPYYSRSEVTYTTSRVSDYTYQYNYTYSSWYTYASNYTFQDTIATTASSFTHNFV